VLRTNGRCRVLPLEFGSRVVRFRWDLRPPHPAWTRNEFTLEYEDDIDLTAMPRALLWTVFLGCTHAIWALLDGYEVELPEPIDPGELEFWEKMAWASRAASGISPSAEGLPGVRLRWTGSRAEPSTPRSLSQTGPPAVLLSCGKESLLSLGLLREARGQVVAINVASSMPGSHDHESTFRAKALEALGQAPGVRVRRVRSDIRATWRNNYAISSGGIASVNELADCFIYPSAALPVAYQHQLPWIALGSEWGEHHVPIRAPGGWHFDRYFSLSGVAIAAVSRLWESRYGVGYTSVIQSISQYLVQRTLLQRYPDLAAFQHSCYRGRADVRACQLCEKCARVTAMALAAGADPAVIGMDVNRVFSRWNATAVELEGGRADTHYASMNDLIRFALANVDRRRAGMYFRPRGWEDLAKARPWRSRRRFNRILNAVGKVAPNRLDTVKRQYLRYMPADLRDPVAAILEGSAPADTTDDSVVHAARAAVFDLLTAPLRSSAAPEPSGRP
jgi:hypothetical protein